MNVQFIEYPACSSCKKAKKALLQHGISVTARHIVEQTPTIEELSKWHKMSHLI